MPIADILHKRFGVNRNKISDYIGIPDYKNPVLLSQLTIDSRAKSITGGISGTSGANHYELLGEPEAGILVNIQQKAKNTDKYKPSKFMAEPEVIANESEIVQLPFSYTTTKVVTASRTKVTYKFTSFIPAVQLLDYTVNSTTPRQPMPRYGASGEAPQLAIDLSELIQRTIGDNSNDAIDNFANPAIRNVSGDTNSPYSLIEVKRKFDYNLINDTKRPIIYGWYEISPGTSNIIYYNGNGEQQIGIRPNPVPVDWTCNVLRNYINQSEVDVNDLPADLPAELDYPVYRVEYIVDCTYKSTVSNVNTTTNSGYSNFDQATEYALNGFKTKLVTEQITTETDEDGGTIEIVTPVISNISYKLFGSTTPEAIYLHQINQPDCDAITRVYNPAESGETLQTIRADRDQAMKNVFERMLNLMINKATFDFSGDFTATFEFPDENNPSNPFVIQTKMFIVSHTDPDTGTTTYSTEYRTINAYDIEGEITIPANTTILTTNETAYRPGLILDPYATNQTTTVTTATIFTAAPNDIGDAVYPIDYIYTRTHSLVRNSQFEYVDNLTLEGTGDADIFKLSSFLTARGAEFGLHLIDRGQWLYFEGINVGSGGPSYIHLSFRIYRAINTGYTNADGEEVLQYIYQRTIDSMDMFSCNHKQHSNGVSLFEPFGGPQTISGVDRCWAVMPCVSCGTEEYNLKIALYSLGVIDPIYAPNYNSWVDTEQLMTDNYCNISNEGYVVYSPGAKRTFNYGNKRKSITTSKVIDDTLIVPQTGWLSVVNGLSNSHSTRYVIQIDNLILRHCNSIQTVSTMPMHSWLIPVSKGSVVRIKMSKLATVTEVNDTTGVMGIKLFTMNETAPIKLPMPIISTLPDTQSYDPNITTTDNRKINPRYMEPNRNNGTNAIFNKNNINFNGTIIPYITQPLPMYANGVTENPHTTANYTFTAPHTGLLTIKSPKVINHPAITVSRTFPSGSRTVTRKRSVRAQSAVIASLIVVINRHVVQCINEFGTQIEGRSTAATTADHDAADYPRRICCTIPVNQGDEITCFTEYQPNSNWYEASAPFVAGANPSDYALAGLGIDPTKVGPLMYPSTSDVMFDPTKLELNIDGFYELGEMTALFIDPRHHIIETDQT